MLALTVPHVDQWNGWLAFGNNHPSELAPMRAKVDAACQAVGRDPATLARTRRCWSICPAVSARPARSPSASPAPRRNRRPVARLRRRGHQPHPGLAQPQHACRYRRVGGGVGAAGAAQQPGAERLRRAAMKLKFVTSRATPRVGFVGDSNASSAMRDARLGTARPSYAPND